MRRMPSPGGTHTTRSRWKVRNISWKRRTWLNSSQRWYRLMRWVVRVARVIEGVASQAQEMPAHSWRANLYRNVSRRVFRSNVVGSSCSFT